MAKSSELSKQEIEWLLEQRLTRLSDDKEVLIYPMGAERYLSSVLFGTATSSYDIQKDIAGKKVLIIPGYGNSAFLFAQAGAQSITVYDKDPVTIAWVKAFKIYYHYHEVSEKGDAYPSIGDLLTALTAWYPPILTLPKGRFKNTLRWLLNPKALRRAYIYYMLFLVQQAIKEKKVDYELESDIKFYAGELNQLTHSKEKMTFDTAFVPYLLGVENGIEQETDIVDFIRELIQLLPDGRLLISPSENTKEFHYLGRSYFETTPYPNIQSIPGLATYLIEGDSSWYKGQGFAAIRAHS